MILENKAPSETCQIFIVEWSVLKCTPALKTFIKVSVLVEAWSVLTALISGNWQISLYDSDFYWINTLS